MSRKEYKQRAGTDVCDHCGLAFLAHEDDDGKMLCPKPAKPHFIAAGIEGVFDAGVEMTEVFTFNLERSWGKKNDAGDTFVSDHERVIRITFVNGRYQSFTAPSAFKGRAALKLATLVDDLVGRIEHSKRKEAA